MWLVFLATETVCCKVFFTSPSSSISWLTNIQWNLVSYTPSASILLISLQTFFRRRTKRLLGLYSPPLGFEVLDCWCSSKGDHSLAENTRETVPQSWLGAWTHWARWSPRANYLDVGTDLRTDQSVVSLNYFPLCFCNVSLTSNLGALPVCSR